MLRLTQNADVSVTDVLNETSVPLASPSNLWNDAPVDALESSHVIVPSGSNDSVSDPFV